MSRINADFKRRRLPPPWLWWVLAVLVTGSLFTGWQAWLAWRNAQSREQELRGLQSQAMAAPKAETPRAAPPYETSARAMLLQQTFPWPSVLTTLEATAIVGVTPTAVDAMPATGQLRVEVQFTDYAKLLEYLQALNAGEPEAKWALVQSQSQHAGLATAVILVNHGR